ncbi:MAG TPA: TlpA disulfide reductase family protein [Bryobacteraceae bacterium]|nr:TlpA disulfide reductase family protein [Bryobacteraceae bacterium]
MIRRYFAVVLLTGLSLALSLDAGQDALPVLRKAPALTFHLPGGGEKTLSDFRGKILALEFIQTTCPHCQAASHVMTKLQKELGSRGFQAIDLAINTTSDEDINAFKQSQQTDFLIGWIGLNEMGHFLNLTPGVRFVVPQMVLIDRKGDIRFQTPPLGSETALVEDNLRQHVLSLLNEKSR